MRFNFRKTAVCVSLAALVSLPTLAVDAPSFADEPTIITLDKSSFADDEPKLETLDESLFDVPAGKNAAFYKERLDQLESRALQNYIMSLNGPEVGVLLVRAANARLAVYDCLSHCEELPPEEQYGYFWRRVVSAKLDYRRKILAAEQAKKPVDFDRLRLAELFVLEGRLLDEAKTSAEKKAVAADILAAARTKFNAPTPPVVAECFLRLSNLVEQHCRYPRAFAPTFRGDLAAALEKSSDPHIRDVARKIQAQTVYVPQVSPTAKTRRR